MQNLFVKNKEFKRFQQTIFCVIKKFKFLTSPNKLDFVRVAVCTFTSLVGPLHFYLRFMLLLGCIILLLVF